MAGNNPIEKILDGQDVDTVINEMDSAQIDDPQAAPIVEEAGVPATEAVVEIETPAEEEWKPDYSFKVLDKVHEFDEEIRPLITKENHTKIKDLYERAYGLDHVKGNYEKAKTELTDYKQKVDEYSPRIEKYNEVEKNLKILGSMIEKGDLDNVFGELGINDQAVMEYAVNKLKMQELPQDQKIQYQNQVRNRSNEYHDKVKQEDYNQSIHKQSVDLRNQQVDFALQLPDVTEFVNKFDTLSSKPGAMREEIFKRGALAFQTQGLDKAPIEIINEIMSQYKPFLNNGTPQTQEVPQGGHTPNTQQVTQKKPVLPKIGTASNSAVKQTNMTFEKLMELRSSMPAT